MRLSCLVVLALAQPVLAQEAERSDALTAARPRLERALHKTADLTDSAFTVEWGPDKKPDGNDPFAALMAGRNSGKVSGSWHRELHHLRFDGDEGDELITLGRRTIARSDAHEWALRSNRFADGNDIPFAPDVQLLLQQLASWQLAITHRDTGSLDDRPIEIVTVTLNQDQVADAIWAGALPAALSSGIAGRVIRLAAGMGGGRTAAQKPDTTVDLAIKFDPATGLIHELHFRAYAGQQQGLAGGRNIVIQQFGAGQVRVGGNDEAEEEEETEPEPGAPLQFENGLPRRSRKQKSVTDFSVRLTEHGQATAPALSDAQKKLLQL
ncbi:MAG: hypothetical protein KDC98_20415 [Planctomycetes bacterium]|nr:hypothetical protein [Planctomycetota bacterium]